MGAQDAPTPRQTICFRGRPAPRCDGYWITEIGVYQPLASTGYTETFNEGRLVNRRSHFENHASIELGRMTNRGTGDGSSAFGGTLHLGIAGAGPRAGIRGRYRYWLDGAAGFEVALGPQIGKFNQPFEPGQIDERYGAGFSGDVSFDLGNLVAATVRADVLRASGTTAGAAYGGVRAGAQAAIAAAAATVAFFAYVFAVFAGSDF